MTPRRLAAAVAACAVLVSAALVTEIVLPRRQEARRRGELALVRGAAPLVGYVIERGGVTLRFVPEADGAWRIDGPSTRHRILADVRAVHDLDASLRAGILEVIAARGPAPAELAQHGLGPPRARLSWTQGGASHALDVGSPAPGGPGAFALTDDGRLVLVRRELLMAVDHPLADFRAKAVLDLPGDVKRLEIVRRRGLPPGASERIVAELRTAEPGAAPTWRLLEPTGHDANPSRILSIASLLASLPAAGFGAEEPAESDLSAAGLAPPAVTVTVVPVSGEPVTLDIGDDAEPTLAWAWDRRGPLVKMAARLRSDLLAVDDEFRDSRVVRLPRSEIVGVALSKGLQDHPQIEIRKDASGAWQAVEPARARVQEPDVERVLDLLDGVRCGRFEDELAKQPDVVSREWDFAAPGSLRLIVSAVRPGGDARRIVLDATLFLHGRDPYYAVRTVDERSRTEVCVVAMTAFDAMTARMRAMAADVTGRAGAGGGSAPDPADGATGADGSTSGG